MVDAWEEYIFGAVHDHKAQDYDDDPPTTREARHYQFELEYHEDALGLDSPYLTPHRTGCWGEIWIEECGGEEEILRYLDWHDPTSRTLLALTLRNPSLSQVELGEVLGKSQASISMRSQRIAGRQQVMTLVRPDEPYRSTWYKRLTPDIKLLLRCTGDTTASRHSDAAQSTISARRMRLVQKLRAIPRSKLKSEQARALHWLENAHLLRMVRNPGDQGLSGVCHPRYFSKYF